MKHARCRSAPAPLAALAAFEALDTISTVLGGRLEGKTPELKTVVAKTRTRSAGWTELQIRTATFGDKMLSKLIYKKFSSPAARRSSFPSLLAPFMKLRPSFPASSPCALS